MGRFGEWIEARRTEGLGMGLSLLLLAGGVGGLGWMLWRSAGRGGGSEFQGKDLSAVRLLDAQGQVRTLGELKGKVVVLDFWATWCPPCRMSLPELAALQRAQGQDYAVVPVSLDEGGFRDVTPFLQQNPQLGLFAVVPADPTKLTDQVGEIRGIPTTLVLDRKGRVVSSWSGFAPGRLERELRTVLGR